MTELCGISQVSHRLGKSETDPAYKSCALTPNSSYLQDTILFQHAKKVKD